MKKQYCSQSTEKEPLSDVWKGAFLCQNISLVQDLAAVLDVEVAGQGVEDAAALEVVEGVVEVIEVVKVMKGFNACDDGLGVSQVGGGDDVGLADGGALHDVGLVAAVRIEADGLTTIFDSRVVEAVRRIRNDK